MIICDTINVRDDRLLDGLIPVVRIMAQMEASKDHEVTIDFSDTKFISPVFALSLLVYISKCEKRVSFQNLTSYLDLIMIIRQLNIQSNVANGLKYMVDETLDNITEHSESDRGYIFAQAYPRKGYLDICIADRGVTLLGSYMSLLDNEIATDLEAIKAANRGLSSKNLPDAENRGFGIKTSKQMLIEGLGGQYLMMSGSCLYIKSSKYDSFYTMPNGIRWNGTIVALRIPYNSPTFNYINYIE